MAISERPASGSCKAAPTTGRCYNRNSRRQQLLLLGSAQASLHFVVLAALLTSSLAMPSESTTILPSLDADVAELTTVNPPQPISIVSEANSPPETVAVAVAAANESSIVEIEPLKTTASEVVDEFVRTSIVSLGGEGLEQGIRNAVQTEVEQEIEADSSAGLVDTLQAEHADHAEQQKPTDSVIEQTDAAQGIREPKTLEAAAVQAEDKLEKPVDDKLTAEAATEIEQSTQMPVETVKDTQQPIETEVVENNEKSILETTSEVEAEESNVAVAAEKTADTSSSGSEQVEQVVHEINNRPLPSVTSDLVGVHFNENRAITEPPITDTNRQTLEHEHDKLHLVVEAPKSTYEETKHQVTKKQGVELPPTEVVEEPIEPPQVPEFQPAVETVSELDILQVPKETENARDQRNLEHVSEVVAEPSNEIEENIIESDAKVDKEVQPVASSTVAPEHVAPTEATVEAVANESNEPVQAAVSETPQEESVPPTEANNVQSVEETQEETEAEIESEGEVEAEPKPVTEESDTAAEVEAEAAAPGETEAGGDGEKQVEGEADVEVKIPEAATTAAPVEPEPVKVDNEEQKTDSDVDSDEAEEQTKPPVVESVELDSSEESDEASGDEPKAKAEDSTATPLVSYPPHNADQTFDSNLADERSSYLPLSSSSRSTLIIALCSGTAVLFIIVSLVIFVLSFQRQHGTLDIEMQEQRLGKDNLEEEDAQMKLLDVDLATPVIIAMGNEETDECL